MPRISAYVTELSAAAVPSLTVDSGTLTSATLPPFSNPAARGTLGRAVGPISISGAMPGDALAVEIRRIRLAAGYLDGQPVDVDDGLIRLPGEVRVAAHPLIGFIATSPAAGEISCLGVGEHGGNLNCRRLRPGARAYLPVSTPGGLLTVGNIQLLRGDGQGREQGILAGGSVDFGITLLKGFTYPTPLIVEGGSVMTLASAATVGEAARAGLDKLARLVATAFRISDAEATAIAGVGGQVRLCQLDEGLATVRVEFSHALLAERGVVF